MKKAHDGNHLGEGTLFAVLELLGSVLTSADHKIHIGQHPSPYTHFRAKRNITTALNRRSQKGHTSLKSVLIKFQVESEIYHGAFQV